MEDSCQNTKIKKLSHNKYSLAQKLSIIYEAEKTSIHNLSNKYSIDRKFIRDWIEKKKK